MTISNSSENKCPICNSELKLWNNKYSCYNFYVPGNLFFNNFDEFKSFPDNTQFHIYLRGKPNLPKQYYNIVQYIKIENNIVNEIYYSDLKVYLNFVGFNNPGISVNDFSFFEGISDFDTVMEKINKVRIFS
jgi:hypothetical protein